MLDNFIASKRFAWMEKYAVPGSSEWIIEPDGFGKTRISLYKTFCKVDFLFPVADKIYIMDWKTGKPDEIKHSKQLTGYSLWVNYHSVCCTLCGNSIYQNTCRRFSSSALADST